MTLGLKLVLLFLLLFTNSSFYSTTPANRLLGLWESEEKNLRISVVEENGHFDGRTIWLLCQAGPSVMCIHCDTENPDPRLTHRKLIGLKVLEMLSYDGNDTWTNGRIYDPNSGRTYDAEVHMTDPNRLVVRGYWKIKLFGRSMVFNRLAGPPTTDPGNIAKEPIRGTLR